MVYYVIIHSAALGPGRREREGEGNILCIARMQNPVLPVQREYVDCLVVVVQRSHAYHRAIQLRNLAVISRVLQYSLATIFKKIISSHIATFYWCLGDKNVS